MQSQRPGEVRLSPAAVRERRWRFAARLLTDDQPDTAASYNNVAYNLDAQGKYARPTAARKALEIRRRLVTDDHPDTAVSYDNLATNLNAQGKYVAAGTDG